MARVLESRNAAKMASYPPPGRGFGQRLEELLQQVEAELRDAVNHVNDTVVPQVRRESISAMRTVSEKLRNLADRLDRQTPPQDPRP
jgi:hypothetical protein